MFEELYWADEDPVTGALMPFYDEPELTDEEHLAEVERLIAADPLNRPEPSAAEVITRGQTEPLTTALVAQLEAVDVYALDEDEAIGYAVAAARVRNRWDALSGLAVARATAVSRDSVEVPRELHAAAQLGAALGLGRNAADTLVTASVELADRLPAAQQMALAGNLTWRKATGLATATLALTGEQARQVEDKVLPRSWQQPTGKFDAAVRKAVDLVDPDGIDARKTTRRLVIRLVRHHYGDGMGQLFADMPSEKLDMTYLAADRWARRRKTDGDPRTLDELRVDALHVWASSFLAHGDAAYCDRICHPTSADLPDQPDPDDPEDDGPDGGGEPEPDPPSSGSPPAAAAPDAEFSLPTGHGRHVKFTVVWDLTSLLGLTNHGGLLLDTNTVISPGTVRELIAAGLRVRRAIIDSNGHLTDLTRVSWQLPATDGTRHRPPVELLLTSTARLDGLPVDQQAALRDLESTDPTLAATVRELLNHPLTADELDAHPGDEQPGAALAAYTCLRAGHPVNPTAGPSPANAADLDHHQPKSAGGSTQRHNLGPLTRRCHRLKTFDGWTVKQTPDGWQWTSPTGRTYLIEPFDYRLGP